MIDTNERWDVADVLPHREPMILIDSIQWHDDDSSSARIRIAEDCPFYEDPHGVPVCVGLEYIAQTVAAHAGIRARKAGDPVRIGFLLGTRRYRANVSYFGLGAELLVTVQTLFEGADLSKFAGSIQHATTSDVIVECAITVYIRKGIPGEP